MIGFYIILVQSEIAVFMIGFVEFCMLPFRQKW